VRLFFLAFWISCGIAAAGFLNADFEATTRQYGIHSCKFAATNQSVSLLIGLGGPISLVLSLALTGGGYSGWQISRGECKQ
jgi:hypothetical protein